jgi:dTDP-glucose 4,6-dehydratase
LNSHGDSGTLGENSRILVTGGAGFIGSNFVRHILNAERCSVVVLDKLTYAGNLDNLDGLPSARLKFVQGDICDRQRVAEILEGYRPSAIINFAAETHVDRSIRGPREFIETNLVGTFSLLECARLYWQTIEAERRDRFRFVNISTDEVYGSVGLADPPAAESSPYCPNSPYSASKAGSDHLARAWWRTYGLPVITTHCSNNYGPYQFPEKLIPLMIQNALAGLKLPIYGDGLHVRDWLFVEDHCEALRLVLRAGEVGETYNIGAGGGKANIEVVQITCNILDDRIPRTSGGSYRDQIAFVADRPGHDRRYALNASKIVGRLGWRPQVSFEQGLSRTVDWYLSHQDWATRLISRAVPGASNG